MVKEAISLEEARRKAPRQKSMEEKRQAVEYLLGGMNLGQFDSSSKTSQDELAQAKQYLLENVLKDENALTKREVLDAIDVLSTMEVEVDIQNSQGSSEDGFVERLAGESFEGSLRKDFSSTKDIEKKARILNKIRLALDKAAAQREQTDVISKNTREAGLIRGRERLAYLAMQIIKEDPKNIREFLKAVVGFDGDAFDRLKEDPEARIRMVKQMKNKLQANLESINKKQNSESYIDWSGLQINQKEVFKKAIEFLDHFEKVGREEVLEAV